MLWEVEIQSKGRDRERDRIAEEFGLLTHGQRATQFIARTARGYLLQGNLERRQAEQLMNNLLVDPLVETGHITLLQAAAVKGFQPDGQAGKSDSHASAIPVTVLPKPGVMDP